MDRYKFRGLRVDNGEWVYGHYYHDQQFKAGVSCVDIYLIRDECDDDYEVHPDTVGQYTGLKDKNGVEIYEGDIVKHIPEPDGYGGWWDGIVTRQPEGNMGWCIEPLPENKHRGRYAMNWSYIFEIIGHIHKDKS